MVSNHVNLGTDLTGDSRNDSFVYRSDEEAIRQAMDKFYEWANTGKPVFRLADYAILFQAGVFEYGAECEEFCAAIYRWGPIPE